jgi:hypothetical protein
MKMESMAFQTQLVARLQRPVIWFLGRGLFSSSEQICLAYGATFEMAASDWQPGNVVVVGVWRVTADCDR